MKIYRSFEEFQQLSNAVVTQGTFDGVHIGHQKILRRLKQIAEEQEGETVLITFFPHPRLVLYPDDNDLKLLNTLDEKIKLLEEAGIDHLIIAEFTRSFSRLSSLQFISDYLVDQIGTKVLVIGYNHRFGKNREGTFEHLKESSSRYGFTVEEIPAQDLEDIAISSTKIRNALLSGEVAKAAKYLGQPFMISGQVIHGNKLGRTIGYPTANIQVEELYKLIPADGVYAVDIEIKDTLYKGMLNIGKNPDFNGGKHAIEVHIFDFSEDIYSQRVKLFFVEKIRDGIKFESVDSLRKQLDLDKFAALKLNP